MVPPPIALALTICERVMVEKGTRSLSLISNFRTLRADTFPFTPAPFYAVATLAGGRGEAELTLLVTDLGTDEEVMSILRRVELPDRFTEVTVIFRLVNCTFPRAGRLRVHPDGQ